MVIAAARSSVAQRSRQEARGQRLEETRVCARLTPASRLSPLASRLASRQPVGIRQLGEHAPQPAAPALLDHGEVGIALADALLYAGAQRIARIPQQIDRHADGNIAADGRVERNQGALRRFLVWRGTGQHAVEDGFAVLAFADLEVNGVDAGLDEISRRVDVEKPRLLTLDLAAQQKRGVVIDVVLRKIRSVALLHVAQG